MDHPSDPCTRSESVVPYHHRRRGTIELDDVVLSVGATALLPAGSEHVVSGDGLMLVTGPAPKTTKPFRIGVDLGGTQTRVAVVDQENVIKHCPSRLIRCRPWQTISHIEHAIRYFSEEFHLTNIGIAAPGPLDARTGHLLSPPNLPGWDDVDLVIPIASRFGLPTHLENDANAAALGEALFGAGQTSSSVYYVTVSTGIGGG